MAVETRGYSSLGKLIKKKLIDKDMTAKELADGIGTTPQYLNKIMHGERSGDKYLEMITKILEIEYVAWKEIVKGMKCKKKILLKISLKSITKKYW